MPEMTPTQQAIADNDARISQQEDFDPKVHGVGTVPQTTPDTVVELHKLHVALEERVDELEQKGPSVVSGTLNSILSRLKQLEQKVFAVPSQAQSPDDVEESGGSQTASPFKSKK